MEACSRVRTTVSLVCDAAEEEGRWAKGAASARALQVQPEGAAMAQMSMLARLMLTHQALCAPPSVCSLQATVQHLCYKIARMPDGCRASRAGAQMGIVGLPNVGKSTLFNVLTKMGIPSDNFPFCTIERARPRLLSQRHPLHSCRTARAAVSTLRRAARAQPTTRASTSRTTASSGCARCISPRARCPHSWRLWTSPGW